MVLTGAVALFQLAIDMISPVAASAETHNDSDNIRWIKNKRGPNTFAYLEELQTGNTRILTYTGKG